MQPVADIAVQCVLGIQDPRGSARLPLLMCYPYRSIGYAVTVLARSVAIGPTGCETALSWIQNGLGNHIYIFAIGGSPKRENNSDCTAIRLHFISSTWGLRKACPFKTGWLCYCRASARARGSLKGLAYVISVVRNHFRIMGVF